MPREISNCHDTSNNHKARDFKKATPIDFQRDYYDHRWAAQNYANRLQMHRAPAILDEIRRLPLNYPKIFDIGCGPGWLTTVLGRFGPATGIDFSSVAIQTAAARYPDVQFLVADLSTQLPFKMPELFDVVVSQEVVEHVEDQAHHIELAAACLKPGGYLILTTPNAYNLQHWTEEALQEWGLQPTENWLTRSQLQSILARRFKVLRLRTIIHGFGTCGVFRILNNPRLLEVIKALHCAERYDSLLERTGFGLHILSVGQRRQKSVLTK